MLRRHPRLFTMNEDSLAARLLWLREELGASPADIVVIVRRQPTLLSLSIEENLAPSLARLQTALHCSSEEARVVARKQPSLLAVNVISNLEPKLDFFRRHMGATTEALRTRVIRSSRVLTVSLERRLWPRLRELQARRIPIDFEAHLRPLTCYTDKEYQAWLRRQERGRSSDRPGSAA